MLLATHLTAKLDFTSIKNFSKVSVRQREREKKDGFMTRKIFSTKHKLAITRLMLQRIRMLEEFMDFKAPANFIKTDWVIDDLEHRESLTAKISVNQI